MQQMPDLRGLTPEQVRILREHGVDRITLWRWQTGATAKPRGRHKRLLIRLGILTPEPKA